MAIGGLWRFWWRLGAIGSGGKAPLWDFHDNSCVKRLKKSMGAALKGTERLLFLLFLGRAFNGTFMGNFSHWRSLEALVEATSYCSGGKAPLWDFHDNFSLQYLTTSMGAALKGTERLSFLFVLREGL